MNFIHRKLSGPFTRWYVKRGYTFDYEFEAGAAHTDGTFSTPLRFPKAVWTCPWWVKPLLIFFSPSVYVLDKYTTEFIKYFNEGLLAGEGEKKDDQT
jgi:hypothetical protein